MACVAILFSYRLTLHRACIVLAETCSQLVLCHSGTLSLLEDSYHTEKYQEWKIKTNLHLIVLLLQSSIVLIFGKSDHLNHYDGYRICSIL